MQTVISAFDDRQTAQRAAERLVEMGFPREDVHLQEPPTADTTEASTEAQLGDRTMASPEREVAVDRGVFSSISHFFARLFGEDEPHYASTYSEAVRRGSSVVVVDAADEELAQRAAITMHELGAFDVEERARQWRANGWMPEEAPAGTVQPGREGVMDVVQEELQVGKRSIDKGGVRVIQRVTQEPVREIVRLREERATVERTPVDRPATAEDMSNFREGTIEVRETAEEPVVAKTARVVEEVRVGKDVREREQAIDDTVRRKDVQVERMEGEGTRNVERERATAADQASEPAAQTRDPDVAPTTLRRTRKSDKDKPGR